MKSILENINIQRRKVTEDIFLKMEMYLKGFFLMGIHMEKGDMRVTDFGEYLK